ncbi:uncharacterized protein LOC128198150 [Bicyclus anynana]|uniref:Uncharacterized protein LOC128198150 n=1 Tax=Bicyclus anynana TaxID=110368 RepID=A0ABM3LFW7_BICAN|nr:uncharacterized protein LOC128198150 [Bicyclus anynana]
MSSGTLVCVICKKDDDKVIAFVEKTLKKSHEVLEIRKHHGLKYNNIVLPVIPNLTDGYHTNCYKKVIRRFQKFCVTYKANTEDEPFKKSLKNCDPSTLPPCKAELQQHLLRTQYITSIWRNAYLRFPSSLTPNRNGWTLHEDTLHFHWFDGDCMPQSLFDAIVHENNKQNNIGNDTTDNAGVSELDTDESEVDSDSSDEGASTEEE